MSMIRLMSQNQWNCTLNKEDWEAIGLDCSAAVRMKGHVRVFEELMPDIVGGQEVNKDMQIFFKLYCLERGLPYTIIWGNMTPLIYRADKFELLDTEYILYPKTVPDFEGKFNDYDSKSVNIGVFRDKSYGHVFIFATTHLWWMGEKRQAGSDEVRRRQIAQAIEAINKYSAKYGNCPAMLVGDMNAQYNTPAISYALNEGGYEHAHNIATEFRHEGRGYNGCNPKAPGKWQDMPFETAIDHILVKNAPDGAVKCFDRYCPDYYLLLSDHAPVYIDIQL